MRGPRPPGGWRGGRSDADASHAVHLRSHELTTHESGEEMLALSFGTPRAEAAPASRRAVELQSHEITTHADGTEMLSLNLGTPPSGGGSSSRGAGEGWRGRL